MARAEFVNADRKRKDQQDRTGCSAGEVSACEGRGKMQQFSRNNKVGERKAIQRVGVPLFVKYKHR